MVDGQIQDQLYVAALAEIRQLFQILHGAEIGVHGVIIRHIVLVIGGGVVDGGQPETLHPQAQTGGGVAVIEIVEAVDNAPEIADAVPVGVGEGAHEDLIKDPGVVLGLGIAAEIHVVNDGLAGRAQQIASGIVPGRAFLGGAFCRRGFVSGRGLRRGRHRLSAGGQQEQQGQDQGKKGAAFHAKHLR